MSTTQTFYWTFSHGTKQYLAIKQWGGWRVELLVGSADDSTAKVKSSVSDEVKSIDAKIALLKQRRELLQQYLDGKAISDPQAIQ